MSTKYRLSGDTTSEPMTGKDVMFAAEIAFGGGLIETMPRDVGEAVDALESAGFELEEVTP